MDEFKTAMIEALNQARDQMPDGAYERFLKVAEESTTMQELMQRLSSTASRYMLSEE
jgi:hypothetical protein